MTTHEKPRAAPVRAYALAAVSVGLALVLRSALDSVWQERLPFVTFFIAVLVVAQLTEKAGPVALAIAAGFLLGDWFFISPRHTLRIADPRDEVNAVFYFVVCSAVAFFSLRARRALARERAAGLAQGQLAAIVESSDEAIIGKSLEGKIVSWNAGAQKLYGYKEAEALGQHITMLVPPEQADELAPLLQRVYQGEHISHFETVRRRKDGGLAEVSLSMSPVRDSPGRIVGVSAIAHGIAERKRAERERERLVGELQRALAEVKTLSGLLSICSHCKKIRDDTGVWNQMEVYIRKRSNAKFSHGLCPECAQRHYPEFYSGETAG